MAIKPGERYPDQTLPPTPAYPLGQARNVITPGDGTGTPVDAGWVNDMWGYLQAVLAEGGITASGNPDTAQVSQYLEAAKRVHSAVYKSVAGIAAITDQTVDQYVFLSDNADGTGTGFFQATSRSGSFTWKVGNFSEYVTADKSKGWFIPSDTDTTAASGCWIRDATEMWVEHFGAVGDDVFNSTLAFQSAIDLAVALHISEVRHGPGKFRLNIIKFPPTNMLLVGSCQENDENDNYIAPAGSGEVFRVIAIDGVFIQNIGLKNTNIKVTDPTDTRSTGFEILNPTSPTRNGDAVIFENVGFYNLNYGWHIAHNISIRAISVHGSGCHTAIGVGGAAESNFYDSVSIGNMAVGAISNITNMYTTGDTVVISAPAHGLVASNFVWLEGVNGLLNSAGDSGVNGRFYELITRDNDSFGIYVKGASSLTDYQNGGQYNRTSIGFWILGKNNIVINATAAEDQTTRGTTCFVVGESDELADENSGTFGQNSNCEFTSCAFGGAGGTMIRVVDGSNANGNGCNFLTTRVIDHGVYFDNLASISRWSTCRFEGSFGKDFKVANWTQSKARLIITPYSLEEIPSVDIADDDFNKLVNYEIGNYGASANLSANQNVPVGQEVRLVFNNVVWQTNEILDPITGGFTVKVRGFYNIEGVVGIGFSRALSNYYLRIRVNGGEPGQSSIENQYANLDGPDVNNELSAKFSFTDLNLNMGDLVTLHISRQTDDTSGLVAAALEGSTRLSITRR